MSVRGAARSAGDPIVLGAVDALIDDGDDDDFVDTLTRVAWRLAVADPRSAARVAGAGGRGGGEEDSGGGDSGGEGYEDEEEGFDLSDAEALLARIAGLGLDPAAKRALTARVIARDVLVAAACVRPRVGRACIVRIGGGVCVCGGGGHAGTRCSKRTATVMTWTTRCGASRRARRRRASQWTTRTRTTSTTSRRTTSRMRTGGRARGASVRRSARAVARATGAPRAPRGRSRY